ncbi:hypothetical protein [Rhizobium leguminosarum]|uniref:hypothetical protein n=1 Tax=Rhizobium leguminosarum TaxID=384 RepID=UPI0004B820F1|nr:hypothetical protein [Rhizobium leguminosarum]
MAEQSIGALALKVVNVWEWYQKALADPSSIGSKDLPVHEDTPHPGYYRVRRKDSPWEPVAIFFPEDSDQLVAYRNGNEVRDINALWVWCCRQPVEFDAYEAAMDGKGWVDEPPTAPGIGDNSGEADPFDALNIEYLGEKEQAEEFMKANVTTQAQADKVAIWAKRLTSIKSRAEGFHKVEKQPHLDAGRAVDDKWRELKSDPDELAKKLKVHIKPFLQEQLRIEEERQSKARAEAEKIRAAREAELHAQIQAAQAIDNPDSEKVGALIKNIERIANEPIEVEARKVNAGRTGARVSMRTEKVGVVTDYGKAAAALVAMRHKDLIEIIDTLAKRAAKAGLPFDGMEIREEERVV